MTYILKIYKLLVYKKKKVIILNIFLKLTISIRIFKIEILLTLKDKITCFDLV